MAALGAVFWMCAWGTRRCRCANGWRLAARVATQGSDSIQQLHTVPKRATPSSFRFSCVRLRKNRLVYVILAEYRLVLPEAKAPQPDHNIHCPRPQSMAAHIMVRLASGVQQAQVSAKAGTNSHQHGRGIWRGSSLGRRRRPLGYAGRAGRPRALRDRSLSYRAADLPNCTETKERHPFAGTMGPISAGPWPCREESARPTAAEKPLAGSTIQHGPTFTSNMNVQAFSAASGATVQSEDV